MSNPELRPADRTNHATPRPIALKGVRIAVTGATGHVGANLVRQLIDAGATVRVIVRQDRRAIHGLEVQCFRSSLSDVQGLSEVFYNCRFVFHCAAKVSLNNRSGDLNTSTNVDGTANVLSACRSAKVKRLIHFSSIAAFHPHPAHEPVHELRPPYRGNRDYDRSKAQAEALVLNAHRKGLDAVIVNPTSIIGPHDFKPSPGGRFLQALFRGRIPVVPHGSFDWVDVRDVVQGAILAATQGQSGHRYILSGQQATFRQLGQIAAGISGRRLGPFVCPDWLMSAALPMLGQLEKARILSPQFSRQNIERIRNPILVTSNKANLHLGYTARPLLETMYAAHDWFS